MYICMHVCMYVYICVCVCVCVCVCIYDEAIHQRNSKVYIYAYTPVHGLVCIIYTLGVLYLPEEHFNSTNNKSISGDCYI